MQQLLSLLNDYDCVGVTSHKSHVTKNLSSGLRPGKIKTGLLIYRDKPEAWNFEYRNKSSDTI